MNPDAGSPDLVERFEVSGPDDPFSTYRGGTSVHTRSRWLWVWMLCAVVAIVSAFAVGTRVRSPWNEAVANAGAAVTVTAKVETRTLTVDSGAVLGTVAAGNRLTVEPTADGPWVVTSTPLAVGDQVASGDAVAEISGRPVLALALTFPLYRDLTPGAEGRDVKVVQSALADLGLYRGSIDGTYGAATAGAVEALYRRVSLPAPAPPADATDAVTAAKKALVAALSQKDDTAADPEGDTAAVTEDNTAAVAEARSALAQAEFEALTPLSYSEVMVIPSNGAHAVSVTPTGTVLTEGTAAVTLLTGDPSVAVRVSVANAPAFAVGSAVEVTSTSDSGVTVSGLVTSVGEFQASPTQTGGPPGYDVTITLAELAGFSDGDSVKVEPAGTLPTIEGTAVPLTALRHEGTRDYVLLQSGDASESAAQQVDVRVLGSADGYAVVESDLSPGDTVIVSGGQ